ncbi:MAG: SBBP repeat-containing protein [Planctomycetes bacterium]|nr:SBBP repeat-containing protein [Planctomycetota bacterium]
MSALLLLLSAPRPIAGQVSPFLRADANADGQRNLTDAVFTLLALFQGGPQPTCLDAADSNDDGALNLTDPVYTLTFLFRGGPPPPSPAQCGGDPTEDGLRCEEFPICEPPVSMAWARTFSTEGNLDDRASALAVDSEGNLAITGVIGLGTGTSDLGTVKYSADGKELWALAFDGPAADLDEGAAIAIDAAGDLYVAGRTFRNGARSADFATVKYAGDGSRRWVAYYPNGGPSDVAVDRAGNVYVTGGAFETEDAASSVYRTVKYDPRGQLLWAARYGGPARATALALGADGAVYVTGGSWASVDSSVDLATVKYDATGSELWSARYDGPDQLDDMAFALVVDASGCAYVTGGSRSTTTDLDYVTLKYGPTGWVARFDGPANAQDQAVGLVVDASGNVYVTGTSMGRGTGQDYATVKYNPAGEEVWVARYDPGAGFSNDAATAIALDSKDYIYVTGVSGADATTMKYDPEGNAVWVSRYPSASAVDMAVDSAGQVYLAGWTVAPTGNDYLAVKYRQAGR